MSSPKRFRSSPSIILIGDRNRVPIINFDHVFSHPVEHHRRFSRTILRYDYIVRHNLTSDSDFFTVSSEIDISFSNLIRDIIGDQRSDSVISGYIRHEELHSSIFLVPTRVSNFNDQCFLDAVYKISQSNRRFLMDGKFDLEISITEPLHSMGYNPITTIGQRLVNKKSIYRIRTTDNTCVPRALVFARFYADPRNRDDRRMRGTRLQETFAQDLCREASVEYGKLLGVEDIDKFQASMSGFQIFIFDSLTTKVKYRGDTEPELWYNCKPLYLCFTETPGAIDGRGHVDVIKSITGFKAKVDSRVKSFCRMCDFTSGQYFGHRCAYTCLGCHKQPKCNGSENILCKDCHQFFASTNCYNNHLEFITNSLNVCIYYTKCQKCSQVYNRRYVHKCINYICEHCKKQIRRKQHNCLIKPLDITKLQSEDEKLKIYVVWDIESCMVRESNTVQNHKAVLIHVKTCCDYCWDFDSLNKNIDDCAFCGLYTHCFDGDRCIEMFGDYIYELSQIAVTSKAEVFAIAHNARSYDNNFILKDLVERQYCDIEIIMQGMKLLRIKCANVRFIDSYAILQQPLRCLPKAYSVLDVAKQFFPHNFHIEENRNYVGPLPPIEEFGYKYMKPNDKRKLEIWHEEHKNDIFDLKAKLLEYCEADCEVLLKCFLKFKKQLQAISGIDPITRCFTLASISLEVFRGNMYKQSLIGITPINGYVSSRKQSDIANAWLDYIALTTPIQREYFNGKFFFDAYEIDSQTVYEFIGCYFHAHKCSLGYLTNRNRRIERRDNQTPNQIWRKTVERLKEIEKDYTLIVMFECKLHDEMPNDIRKWGYIANRQIFHRDKRRNGGPIIPRDAFFGGRTNNLWQFYAVNDINEDIKFVDFRSLYPYVLKNRNYPIGHPVAITEDFEDLDNYFGLVKCIVLPPRDLFIPVLPIRMHDKLIFPLCYTCALNKQQTKCEHYNGERQFCGTFVIEEVLKAVSLGYTIMETFEVLHFPQTSKDLFTDYVNLFLKIKQESEGFPEGLTEPEKLQYISDFEEAEGILLDYENICKNSARRSIAKLHLNCLWGKLAQRNNLPTTEVCRDHPTRWNLIKDDKKHIVSDIALTPKVHIVNWKYKNEAHAKENNTSIILASFVTAYARLKLYEILEEKEHNVLYFDTDSLIYVLKPGEEALPLGNNLGELTDEIVKDYGFGARVTKFVSCGPKTYALEIVKANGTTCSMIKAKGITLNSNTVNIINFENMLDLAKKYINGENIVVKVPQMLIKADRDRKLYTRYLDKQFRVLSEKRRIACGDGEERGKTLPYGYYR